ncbi:MAG TPA: DUF2794 domain-containing protein [Devosiaceae bacterium]
MSDLVAPGRMLPSLSVVSAGERSDPSHHRRGHQALVSFDRQELGLILGLYGRKIASGEWRDYALDMMRDRALFSVYRRASERPMFIIEKNPRLGKRQGQYLVTNHQGRILKRGHVLAQVLKALEPGLVVVK